MGQDSGSRGLHALGQLQTEIELLGRCAHPHLLPVVGYSYDPYLPCLVYPLCAGGNFEVQTHGVRTSLASPRDLLTHGMGSPSKPSARTVRPNRPPEPCVRLCGASDQPLYPTGPATANYGRCAAAAAARRRARATLMAAPAAGACVSLPPKIRTALLTRLWRPRLQVVRDVADALIYLHTPVGGKPRILHRDVKPSNILLSLLSNTQTGDDDAAPSAAEPPTSPRPSLRAWLSDVGVAKVDDEMAAPAAAAPASAVPPPQTHLSTSTIRGTPGFVDSLVINGLQVRTFIPSRRHTLATCPSKDREIAPHHQHVQHSEATEPSPPPPSCLHTLANLCSTRRRPTASRWASPSS